MSQWTVLMRGLPGEIAAVQSWLNANEIPTITRTAEVHSSVMELLVPVDKVARAKELLAAISHSQHAHDDEARGDWDE
jgi:hypothetical protein